MDSFANYHHRLWAWSGLVIKRVVQFTGWWMGVAFVMWACVVTLIPALLITHCVINARAGELSLSEVLRTFFFSAFAIPLIRAFPPTKVWTLTKELWRGLPFILNILTFGLVRVAQHIGAEEKGAVKGLPANCKVQRLQTPTGPTWGILQRKDGERMARVIATGASPENARQNARKFLGLV